MTKLFGLGAIGALGALAAVGIKRRRDARQQATDAFELGDLDEPVVVSEEVVIVTEAGPYAIDMEVEPR